MFYLQAEGGEKFRSKRKRLGSSSSRSAAKLQRTEATVAPRTDLRAKFYSKVRTYIPLTAPNLHVRLSLIQLIELLLLSSTINQL